MKKDILERFKGEETRIFEQLVDLWLNWVKNDGSSMSCESRSKLGWSFYDFMDDLHRKTSPYYSEKDPYG